MPERDELDRLIDSELARYAEPRTGLEQRVMVRVLAEASARSWVFGGRWRWALAGAAALAIVLVTGIERWAHDGANVNTAGTTILIHEPPSPTTRVPEIHVQGPPSKQTARKPQNATRRPKSVKVAESARHPKLDVFPAPQPLSAKEQSMLEFAKQLPDAERQRLVADQKSGEAALEISSIRISPIIMPGLGKN